MIEIEPIEKSDAHISLPGSKSYTHRALIVSGGVACNSGLRAAATALRLPYPVHFPGPALATDNAAMIALAGAWALERNEAAGLDLTVDPGLPLS